MLALFSGIFPLISSSEKSFSSLFSMTPSLCRLREAPSHLSCDTVFPIPCCQTLAVLPPTKKIEGFARDDDTRRMRFPHTLSLHDARDIHSLHCHFERSREILLALCSFLLLSQKFSPFPLSHIRRYTGVQERSLDFARDDDTGIALSNHIRWTLREINPFPHTVISSAARNLPCTLLFLAPFAKVFPFSAITHTALYRCARKIPRLRSG